MRMMIDSHVIGGKNKLCERKVRKRERNIEGELNLAKPAYLFFFYVFRLNMTNIQGNIYIMGFTFCRTSCTLIEISPSFKNPDRYAAISK